MKIFYLFFWDWDLNAGFYIGSGYFGDEGVSQRLFSQAGSNCNLPDFSLPSS
jgi:hypothetical protein